MNRSWVRLLHRCAAIAAFLLLAGCVSGVPVSVTNHSASELRQVTVSGTGFSERIGTIAAGATETVRVRPRAETAVKVAFEVDGERYSAITEGEIENDNVNTVAVTVADDLSISMETQLR